MSDTRSSTGRPILPLAATRRTGSNSSSASISEPSLGSSFDLENDDVAQSTRHNINEDDSHYLPKIRATAEKRNMGYYNPPPPAVNIPTSAVRREFQDFDENYPSSENDSRSVEIGRAFTPSRNNSAFLVDRDSGLFEITSTPRNRTNAGSLRRNAVVRRASHKQQQQESFIGNTGAGIGSPAGVRSAKKARNSPMPVDSPRGTAQSFLLPNIPDLTDLVAGKYNDGTPIFDKTTKSRSRFAAGNGRPVNQPNFLPLSAVPMTDEEKAIFASLQLLKDKVAQLEQDKAQSDRKIEDYENELFGLRAQLDSQGNLRRSDSALGSTDGEGSGKQSDWKQEKSRLESSLSAFQKRLERAERKASTAETATKRITTERDSVVTQLGVAFLNSEELKTELETVQNEIRLLQDQVTDLQTENHELVAENDELRGQLDEAHAKHQEDSQRWAKKEALLNRKASTSDRALVRENQTMREELEQLRTRQQDVSRQGIQRETEIVRKVAQEEHAKLARENEQLKQELDQARASREAEMQRWAEKKAKLEARVERQEETIHHMNTAVPQSQINEELRSANEELKTKLAKLKAQSSAEQEGTPKAELRQRLEEVTAQRVDEKQRWTRKESVLKSKLDEAREFYDLNKQLNDGRDTRGGAQSTARRSTEARSKRKSTGQAEISIHDSINEQIEREVQKNRSASAAQTSASAIRAHSRSKSQSRRQLPPRNLRHSSAPVVQDLEDSEVSDVDIAFEQAETSTRRTDYLVPKAAQAPAHTGDTTFISFIEGDVIANMRKQLEEEHAAKRRLRSVTAPIETTRNLTQKSSFKDLTGRSKASSTGRKSAFEEVDPESEVSESEDETQHTRQDTVRSKQDTVRSNMSRASRASARRRTAGFTEMTSAFIVPDITLHVPEMTMDATTRTLLAKLSTTHDTKNCSVCQRIIGSSLPTASIPTPVPVSTRPEVQADIDATLRPTQPPLQSLSVLIKQLTDELVHLKLELHVMENKLQSTDPALGKRARKSLHEKLNAINRSIETKSDQIYALYDILEAHKGEGAIPEEVERTMESLRNVTLDRGLTGMQGKKVAFGADGQNEEEEDSDDAPWAGISDTESLHHDGR